MEHKIYNWIFTLKAIAIILITNSHFKPIYPNNISQFAFGGAMGCAIFFFCSGFTMASIDTSSFLNYITKRIIRIIPPVWIFSICITNSIDWKDYILIDSYWFLQAIIVFYILFYLTMKYLKNIIIHIALFMLVLLLLIYNHIPHNTWIIDYAAHPYHITWFYYFSIMLVGAYCRIKEKSIIPNKKHAIYFLFSFITLYGIKYIGSKYIQLINIQLLFPILLIISTLIVYKASQAFDKIQNKYINRCIMFLQRYTLEIYIVQFSCIHLCNTSVNFYR